MTLVFWLVVALLIASALLFVVPPLLQATPLVEKGDSPLLAYREQRARLDDELMQGTLSVIVHAQCMAELQDRVAHEVGEPAGAFVPSAPISPQWPRSASTGALYVALLLPAGVVGLYAWLGQPAGLKTHGVEGTVLVRESLKPKIPPGATLFIFARPTEGLRTPLAILRVPVRDFPQRFRLDDSLAMSPDAVLSSHAMVTLGARISASGDATPRTGDLVGTLGPIKYGTSGVRLVIDGAMP